MVPTWNGKSRDRTIYPVGTLEVDGTLDVDGILDVDGTLVVDGI